jgi:hypothetical protein
MQTCDTDIHAVFPYRKRLCKCHKDTADVSVCWMPRQLDDSILSEQTFSVSLFSDLADFLYLNLVTALLLFWDSVPCFPLALQSFMDLGLLDDLPLEIPIKCFLPPCLYFQ